MTDESLGERIVRIETQMTEMMRQSTMRATREWAIIMTGLALVGTIIVKSMGN